MGGCYLSVRHVYDVTEFSTIGVGYILGFGREGEDWDCRCEFHDLEKLVEKLVEKGLSEVS